MRFQRYGRNDETAPLLVCAHGLMGSPDDFAGFLGEWEKAFQILVPDMAGEARERGYKTTSANGTQLCYDSAADAIASHLAEHFPGRRAFFTGVSLGGKIVYDFAGRYPEQFEGGVVTDVGPGALTDSDLCHFLDNVVGKINLAQPWRLISDELRQKIPERMLRILMQTQIAYSEESQTGHWKPSIRGVRGLLRGARIEFLWDEVARIRSPIDVLLAESLSGISAVDLERMRTLPCFRFQPVPEASHFLQVTHPHAFRASVLALAAQGPSPHGPRP